MLSRLLKLPLALRRQIALERLCSLQHDSSLALNPHNGPTIHGDKSFKSSDRRALSAKRRPHESRTKVVVRRIREAVAGGKRGHTTVDVFDIVDFACNPRAILVELLRSENTRQFFAEPPNFSVYGHFASKSPF